VADTKADVAGKTPVSTRTYTKAQATEMLRHNSGQLAEATAKLKTATAKHDKNGISVFTNQVKVFAAQVAADKKYLAAAKS
jgi:hypothetical protein